MSLIEKGNWPASRKKAAERRALELPMPPVIDTRVEIRDGRPFLVKVYPMAHEADMLRGNADA